MFNQVAYIGKWPGKGPQGEDLDEVRKKRAGTPLSDHFAVVEYRGDWILGLEFENTFIRAIPELVGDE